MPAPAGKLSPECAHTVVAELVDSSSLLLFTRGSVQPQSGDWTLPDLGYAPQGAGAAWLQDAGRIGMACRHRLGQPPVGGVAQEPRLAGGAVRWQAQVEERLFHRVVPHAHLHDLARLLRR